MSVRARNAAFMGRILAMRRTVTTMTNDTAVFVCLVILAITVIPISFWTVFVMSREIDTVVKRCDSMKGNVTTMKVDLISRQAAVEAMRRAKDKSELHRMLVQLPSAQKYGTWIVSHFGANAKCSECGMYCVGVYDHDRCDQYCRCCGAKMDGLKLEGGQA